MRLFIPILAITSLMLLTACASRSTRATFLEQPRLLESSSTTVVTMLDD